MRLIPLSLIASIAVNASVLSYRDGSYVQDGRSLVWRLVVPSGLDTTVAQPAYLFLHGNSSGTQQDMLDLFRGTVADHVSKRGGIGLVLASPDYCNGTNTTRCWDYDPDGRLLLSALRSGFGGQFKIDTSRVVLHGGSQGSCFLSDLLQSWTMGIGGGALHECGCHVADYQRVPDSGWAAKFKVYVAGTTEDFLYDYQVAAADHFRWWSRFETRANLLQPGGHCASPASTTDSALDWITGRIEIPQPPFEPHWERIAPFPKVRGVVVTAEGTLWAAQSTDDTSHLWKSMDGGRTWENVWSLPDSLFAYTRDSVQYVARYGIGGLAAVGETVVLSHLRMLYVFRPDGSLKSLRTPNSFSEASLSSESSGRLWIDTRRWGYSDDTGSTWHWVPAHWTRVSSLDRSALSGESGLPFSFVSQKNGKAQLLFPSEDFAKADSIEIPDSLVTLTQWAGAVWAFCWNGTRQVLYRRVGGGGWESRPWPTDGALQVDSTRLQNILFATSEGWLGVLGWPSFVERIDGSYKRMPGGWFEYRVGQGSLARDGRIFRAGGKAGILAWVPREDASIWGRVAVRPGRKWSSERVRRDGAHLVLPSEGIWSVRWLDARGRVLRSSQVPGGSRLEARPSGSTLGPQWIEVVGPSSRGVIPVLR